MNEDQSLSSLDVRFIIKLILESKSIHGQDIDKVVFLLNKLKSMLKE